MENCYCKSSQVRLFCFVMNYIFIYFIIQCTINIVFDRVGKVDPVTRGLQIAVNYMGLEVDVKFWSQHISFILVGIIVITSIRGLLITLTKVSLFITKFLYLIFIFYFLFLIINSFSMQFQVQNLQILSYLR